MTNANRHRRRRAHDRQHRISRPGALPVHTLPTRIAPTRVPPRTFGEQEKSTLILGLLRQFLRDGLPFWSVDFKRNYRCLLNDQNAGNLVVLTVGRDTAPLQLNMLRAPRGVEPAEWVEALTDTISSAYLLMQGARNVLKECLLSLQSIRMASVRCSGTRSIISGSNSSTRAPGTDGTAG